MQKLKAKNIKIFSFTNQPGIADGIATVADFVQELEGFGFDDIYVCPHKHGDGCECRKPSTGICLKQQKHGLNLTQCAVVGDRWTDIVAGAKVNATTILVEQALGMMLCIRTETNGHILNQTTLQITLKMQRTGF